MSEPVLLLDTHVWIWIVEGVNGKLSPSCLDSVRAATGDRRLLISVISIWEVANLEAKGRISLSMECHAWVHQALTQYDIDLAELSPEIAIDSTRLPDYAHGDPADRILMATARHRNATLVTGDRRILEYARSHHVRAVNAFSQTAWQ